MDELLGKLMGFAISMFDASDWPDGGDVDMFEFQEAAIEHGLLLPEIRHEFCEEECACHEGYDNDDKLKGWTCYRIAPWLAEERRNRAAQLHVQLTGVGADGEPTSEPVTKQESTDGTAGVQPRSGN